MRSHRLDRAAAWLAVTALAGCGARSSLDGASVAGPSCAAMGAPCATSADCCDAACEEQICGGPPCHPGDAPVVLSSGVHTPFSIAIDASTIYVTLMADHGAVLSVPKAGGATKTLVPNQFDPESVAVDEDAVYWTSYPGIVGRVDKSGANLVTLAKSEPGASGIALDATHVYWVDYLEPGSVNAIPKEGGKPQVLAPGGTGFSRIAVGADSVTWVDFYKSAVLRVPKQGGPVVTVAALPGLVGDVALDGDVAYASADTSIFRIDAPGAMPAIVAPIGGSGAARLVVDGDRVFYTDSKTGDVARVSKTGGAPTFVAQGQAAPVGIAVDAWCVYWVNAGIGIGTGQVMKAPR